MLHRKTRTLAASLLSLVLLPSLAAQDTIHWHDGTVTTDAKVSAYTVSEIRYVARGSREVKTPDLVRRLVLEKVQDTYRRGVAEKDPSLLVGVARQQLASDPFIAQFGLWMAAEMYMDQGKAADAFPLYDEIIDNLPESGFVPHAFAAKADYYLSTDKAKSAQVVAQKYYDTASTKAFPDGYLAEAEFYTIMAEAMGGSMPGGDLRSRLETLALKTEVRYPFVANRARLQIGNSFRHEGMLDEAHKVYERLANAKVVDPSTLSGAMLGLGHIDLARGSDADREAYRAALLAFLRVYLDAQESAPDLAAEALFHGAEASLKWGGTDSQLMAGRLRWILRNDDRYSGTEWAQKR